MIDLLAQDPSRTSHLERSFIVQRTGMALLAAVFPFVFLASSYIFGRTEFQASISRYYWTLDPERNFFVGALCAIGVFLLLYKGYNWLEDRVLDAAGIGAVGTAFFPTIKNGGGGSFSLHGFFAVTFFACIFFICIFMSDKSLQEIVDLKRREWFRKAYRICSGVMVVSILLAVVTRFLPDEYTLVIYAKGAIFWFEAVGVWSFSAYWYIKTRELDPSRSWMPLKKNR